MRRRTIVAVTAASALVALGAARQPSGVSAPADAPTLVVLVTVDQFREDYFQRFGPQLTGGLARLRRGGAVLANAHQDHAITETAPGHASMLSGRFPRSTGIASNSEGVDDQNSPLVDVGGTGASPHRFRGTTLFDWLHDADRRARALSVSMKDRGAILPLGRAVQEVYWYASNGRFTTSTYYRDTLPEWVRRFNARRAVQRRAGTEWTLLLPDSAYAEPDSVFAEAGGADIAFPHRLPNDSARAAGFFRAFPWMDELTLDLALEGMLALGLGRGPQTDVLAVSLSATDVIGHRYGPDSRELHDQILRLDRMLGRFLDSLFVLRDSTRIAIAFTSDHGVAPFPELVKPESPNSARNVDLGPAFHGTLALLRAAGVDTFAIGLDGGIFLVDRRAFKGKKLSVDRVVEHFRAAAAATPGVARVDRVSALARHGDGDEVARRWRHLLPAGAPAELVVTLTPYSVWGNPPVAMHGSPYDYDTHVPLIFYGPWFRTGIDSTFVRVVDLAPTLARVVGVTPSEQLDGRALRSVLR